MELRVKNPYTAELAYRWYIATYKEMIEDLDKLRETIEQEEHCTSLYEKRLNEEISVRYHLCMDNEDNDIEIEYVLKLFGHSEIKHYIPIFHEAVEVVKNETKVRSEIEQFCNQTYYVCKCGELAKPRLGFLIPNPPPNCIEYRCETCYLYWFKRTDDRCAVCLEDEGVWVKLSCGHILHQHCWGDIEGMACPVCRSMTDSKKNVYHYPFITCPDFRKKALTK
jgi:hypothetical protein